MLTFPWILLVSTGKYTNSWRSDNGRQLSLSLKIKKIMLYLSISITLIITILDYLNLVDRAGYYLEMIAFSGILWEQLL